MVRKFTIPVLFKKDRMAMKFVHELQTTLEELEAKIAPKPAAPPHGETGTWLKPVDDVLSYLPSNPKNGDRVLLLAVTKLRVQADLRVHEGKVAQYDEGGWTFDAPSPGSVLTCKKYSTLFLLVQRGRKLSWVTLEP